MHRDACLGKDGPRQKPTPRGFVDDQLSALTLGFIPSSVPSCEDIFEHIANNSQLPLAAT